QQLEATLARELRQPPVVDRSVTPARFEQMQSLLALNAFVAHLRKPSLPYAGAPRVVAGARELVELLGHGAEHGAGGDWLVRFAGALREYGDAVARLEREIGDAAPALVEALRRFAVYS